MKLLEYFKYFLTNEVNLNQTRIDTLDNRVAAITTYLKGDPVIGPILLDVIAQGSYAHRTIIRPQAGRDFDADVLIQLVEQDGWEPRDYIAQLRAAFMRSETYKSMISRKTRCVVAQYANGFHIDCVPYVERFGQTYITNRHENVFELTNPEGFNEWLEQQNRTANGHLVEVIRLMKFLRDFKGTFGVKSIVLSTLLGGRVNAVNLWGDPKYYCDLPTTLLHVVKDLNTYLQANEFMPVISDPGGTGDDFSQRWDRERYANFRNKIQFYAGKIEEAYDETDKDKCLASWQAVFGTEFKKPPAKAIQLAEAKAVPQADNEMFLDRDFGIPFVSSTHELKVVGRVVKKAGWRDYPLVRRGNRVAKSRTIKFGIVSCDVPAPYDVYWKVKNTGPEARAANQLRGEIKLDPGGHERREPTAFRGSHYVECYVVKDGRCVARDVQRVVVE